jgi:mannitol-1-/sugar-/sorbitol-6-/2-deoxyglucose-6-phosphatase
VIDAVIFDMDGLLIDSEPLWVRAEIAVFGSVGVLLCEEDCALTKGLRTDDVVGYWHARRPWSGASPRDLEARLVEAVAELVRAEGQPLPGIATALQAAAEEGRRLALASSSPSRIIRAALERLGLEAAFSVVQSAETEPLGKPHPGIFLTTAERLGVRPTACLVLEDSLTGVIAAKAARMACVAVPFDHPKHDPRFCLADASVASLEEVTPELLARLARPHAQR